VGLLIRYSCPPYAEALTFLLLRFGSVVALMLPLALAAIGVALVLYRRR